MNQIVNPQIQAPINNIPQSSSSDSSRHTSPIRTYYNRYPTTDKVLNYGMKGISYVYKIGMGYMVYKIWKNSEEREKRERRIEEERKRNKKKKKLTKDFIDGSKNDL